MIGKLRTYVVLKADTIEMVVDSAEGMESVRKGLKNKGFSDPNQIVELDFPFEGLTGQKKDEFDDNWNLRPLYDRWKEGFVTLPDDETMDVNTHEIRLKTEKEMVDDGTREILSTEEWDDINNQIITKKWSTKISEGIATYENWLDEELRPTRDSLLNETDRVYLVPDRWMNYTEEERQAWAEYKQALRDLPQNKLPVVDKIEDVAWPQKPL